MSATHISSKLAVLLFFGAAWVSSPRFARADPEEDRTRACIAESYRGQSERDDGKYRSAREAFRQCARDDCPRVVDQACTKWLHELDETSPTIVLAAKDGEGNDISEVKVTFDGSPFATILDGRPIEADPGIHVLRFDGEGVEPVEQRLILRAGERARVVGVVLKRMAARGRSPEPRGTGRPETASAASAPPASLRWIAPASLGLLAVASVGAGAELFAHSGTQGDQAAGLRRTLGTSNACANAASGSCQQLSDEVHAQYTERWIATGLFVGGGLLAAGAIVSWFLWPHPPAREPQATASVAVGREGFALRLERRF